MSLITTGNIYDPKQNALVYGAATTISTFLSTLKGYQSSTTLSAIQKLVFGDLIYMAERVANTMVSLLRVLFTDRSQIRNAGSIGGNLMLANKHSFPSDLCIALMGIAASLVIGNKGEEKTVALQGGHSCIPF